MEENNNVEVLEEKNEVQEIKSEAAPIQPKKKGNGGLIVIIVLLLAVCIGLGGFVFINKDKLFSSNEPKEEKDKKESKKEEKEPVVTNYAVTDEKVAKLIDKLVVGLKCKVLEDFTNDKKVEAKDISQARAYKIAEINEFFNSGKQSITLDEFTKAVQKYLGKNYQFDPEKMSDDSMEGLSCISYLYDKNNKVFNYQQTACGGTCGPMPSYKIVKAVDIDGVLKLDVKVIFADTSNESRYGYYSEYQKTNKIGTFEDDREYLYDKGANYQFTFKLEDGNYVFVSSEPVK